jgi:cyanophycin synthetase
VLTNISEDHLGLDDVHSLEDLAQVKAVVPRSTLDSGYAVLNAENEYVYNIKNELTCNIALFSMDPDNPRIANHCEREGIAAVIEDGYFVIRKGKWKNRIAKVKDVPLTFSGTAAFMSQNILAAMLAAFVEGIDVKSIHDALMCFIPSHELTPGRMNLFNFEKRRLMIDYVHNKDGYAKMKDFVDTVKASQKVGIISGTGDRRDDDIQDIGRYAGETFDEIIIRHDKDLRGRNKDEITRLLTEGIRETNPDIPILVISDEFEAIEFALEHSEKDAFIFETADHVQDTLNFVLGLQKRDTHAEEQVKP